MRSSVFMRVLSTAVATTALLGSTAALGPVAAAATVAPDVVSPVYGASVASNPVLDWAPVAGASRYRVQVSPQSGFSTLTYSQDTYATRATPPSDLPLGTLWWRVAGIDSTGVVGSWSSGVQFTKNAAPGPVLTSPAEAARLVYPDQAPVLTWEGVPGVKSYTVTLADNDAFSGAQTFNTTNTQHALAEPLTLDKTYYWKVRGISATVGVTTADSEVRSFSMTWPAVPGDLSPVDRAEVHQVALSWSPLPGAKYYELEVSPNGDFTNNLVVLDTGKRQKVFGTRYSPTTTLPVTSYFWRVRGVDNGAVPHPGPWTTPIQFTLRPAAMPTGLSVGMEGASTVGNPDFSWDPVGRASAYELVVSDSDAFITHQVCTTQHTSFTPYSASAGGTSSFAGLPACNMTFAAGKRYYWRVRALDQPSGNLGTWSMTATFVFREDVPVITGPAEGSSTAAPVLSWQSVPGFAQYEVSMTLSGTTAITRATYATTYTPVGSGTTASPTKPGSYTWSVRTVAQDGTRGPWSPPATYTLEAPTPTAQLLLVGPDSGSESVSMPSMTWTPVDGASHYRVWYRADGSSTVYPLLASGTGTPPKLFLAAVTKNDARLPTGLWHWHVKAYNSSDVHIGDSVDERSFRIVNPSPIAYAGPPNCAAVPADQCEQGDTPEMRWQSADGASHYQVTLAGDALFTNKLRTWTTQYLTLTPREALPDNQAGQSYYWFVQPCTDLGCPPADADKAVLDVHKQSFRKSSLAVQLSSPADGTDLAAQDEVHFSWVDYDRTNALLPTSSGARTYHLQVAIDSAFNTLVDDVTVDSTVHTVWTKAYPDGVYYWRVQAVDGASQGLTWSPTRVFKRSSSVPVPQPVVTTTTLPTLRWPALPYSGSYTVEVYSGTDPVFPSVKRISTATTKFAAFTPSAALPAGDYSWRVRKVDPVGNAGPWSSTVDGRVPTFRVTQAPPTLLSPDDRALVRTNDQLFTWQPPAGAAVAAYRFEASTSSAFSTIAEAQNTVMQEWAPTAFYQDGKTYFWRVRILDGAGNVLATSPIRGFTKDAVAPTVASGAASGAPVVGPIGVTFSEPVKGLTTSSVRLRVTGTATYVSGKVAGNGTTTASFTPTAALVPGGRYDTVLSSGITDLAGNPLVATTRSFRTQVVVESDSPAVAHAWDRDTSTSASGGGFLGSATRGAAVDWSFSGTGVALVGRLAPDGGNADVYLDGVKVATVSSYASTVTWKKTLYASPTLAAGTHRLRVVVAGTRPTGSTGTWFWLDGYRLGTAMTEETAAKQSFARVATTSSSAGSHVTESHLASGDTGTAPEYRYKVHGTSVRISGVRLPTGGQATVLVDGAVAGTIDAYASSTSYKVSLFSRTGLSDTAHTVVIRLTGTKAPASTGYAVPVDVVGTS